MSFLKESVNRQPLADAVFAIAAKAKEDKELNGPEHVVDATIGSLYGEDGKLVALDTVYDSLKNMDNRVLAKYASSFTGNPDFKEHMYDWGLDGNSSLAHDVVATPGGTGAVAMGIDEFLEAGETIILPNIAWGSYKLMAQMDNLNIETYEMFDGDAFNLKSFKEVFEKVMVRQNKLVIVINSPCHNPTGYSLTDEEWAKVVEIMNECAKSVSVVLINDVAYIDFAYGQKAAKKYFRAFDKISDNVVVEVAYSLSKSMTSYGLRCGAAILLAQQQKTIDEIVTVFAKDARATWSNINNGAMAMFVDVLDNKPEEYNAERQKYVDLLQKRSSTFIKEADEVGLSHYPYKEGFFVTLNMDNKTRDAYHEALMANHIYTVKVNQGIRVAVCSLPVSQCQGLAAKMKKILDTVQ
ncbi:MAG: pyridoxal phosphate-dependent aminotransferase [Catenisphaera adipataccumulans]|jgi:aspartate/tyrosine/aromatic aminotransferase|uniref:pyridoxal phosphate-dependent aminotransferase n=1 Tax=Catenisphaera adipataccumulans TaxID=700500 RepID=UPI003D93ED2A